MRSDKFDSQLERKSKIWFFTILNLYVPWIVATEQTSDLTVFAYKIQVFCKAESTKRGTQENEFWEIFNRKIIITNS